MTARQYLLQAREIQIRLGAMAEQLAFLRTAAEYITPQYSTTLQSATRNIHKNEDAIVRVLDFEARMKAQYDKLDVINMTIAAVSSPLLQSLLVKRYIADESWEEIAEALSYSMSQVKRFHLSALNEVDKMLNRNEPK